jgi:serine O-acetyltransferase
MGISALVEESRELFENRYQTRLRKNPWLLMAVNPSIRASVLFRLCSVKSKWHFVFRNILISLHSCDVSEGSFFDGAVLLPHPIGICIGKGARIGKDVTIYQGVTIGSGIGGRYPVIGDGAVIYTNSVVVGGAVLPDGEIVRANATVSG